MNIPILVESLAEGRYRAHAGSPFTLMAEGTTASEAMRSLREQIKQKLANGSRLEMLEFGNETSAISVAPLEIERLPDDDWFFKTMREAIEENRRAEDEAKE